MTGNRQFSARPATSHMISGTSKAEAAGNGILLPIKLILKLRGVDLDQILLYCKPLRPMTYVRPATHIVYKRSYTGEIHNAKLIACAMINVKARGEVAEHGYAPYSEAKSNQTFQPNNDIVVSNRRLITPFPCQNTCKTNRKLDRKKLAGPWLDGVP